MSLPAKKQIWNPSHHFTNAELAHRCLPQLTMCGTSQRQYELGQKQGKTLVISRLTSGGIGRYGAQRAALTIRPLARPAQL
jgi:hypothetical protein